MSASKDDVVWKYAEYGRLDTYESLDENIKTLQKAKKAMNDGLWADLQLTLEHERYGSDDEKYISIRGKRPENEVERVMRIQDQTRRDEFERQQYERLKEKFDGPVKEKKS